MQKLIFIFIKSYQYIISPCLGCRCRFYPSCSAYAIDAMKTYGICKGVYFAVLRVLRCNPFGGHGLDFVSDAGDITKNLECKGEKKCGI